MKTKLYSVRTSFQASCTLTILLLAAVPTAHSQENATTKDDPTLKEEQISTFIIPSSLIEGRDPFFPKSTRFIYRPTPAPTNALGPVVLEFKGISGTSERPLAIINNRTFAVGEEQDVNTAQGRVRVICLEIDGMRVKVRSQGETRDLFIRKGI